MSMGLPLRLQSLLDRCEPGFPLWDLCCDHGLLGLEALESGLFPQVIFNDAVPHVLELLAPRLAGREDAKLVLSRAEDIPEILIGNLVIAGVGGEKIFKILMSHANAGRLKARRVIVCPEKHADWLSEQSIPGLRLEEHVTIPHNHHTRQILFYKTETETESESDSDSVSVLLLASTKSIASAGTFAPSTSAAAKSLIGSVSLVIGFSLTGVAYIRAAKGSSGICKVMGCNKSAPAGAALKTNTIESSGIVNFNVKHSSPLADADYGPAHLDFMLGKPS